MLPLRTFWPACLWAVVALPAVVGIWGFTVDDALISARVAEHLADGSGYRFNSDGPVTDAVTPLGWAYFLKLGAGGGVWQTFEFARHSGVLAWLIAAVLLGHLLQKHDWRTQLVVAASLATCLPLAAWAVTGMETAWVTLLCVLSLGTSRWSPLAAGASGALRPELLPWAVVVSVLRCPPAAPRREHEHLLSVHRRRFEALALATVPAVLVGAVRWMVFGTPVPLAAVAKPSDFAHGFSYVVVALLFAGPPWLLVTIGEYRKLEPRQRALLYALLVHLLSLGLAGGVWMSFFRLLVPVLPSVLVLGASLAAHASFKPTLLRLLMALVSTGSLWWLKASEARGVAASRRQLIEAARQPLKDANVVAAVDIGWVGAATAATVVDLAGVTDPVVAEFSGGHTTKRVPSSLLGARNVDTLVLLLDDAAPLEQPWYTSRFYYGVDRRVARGLNDLAFEPIARLPLAGSAKQYVVLRLADGAAERPE